MQHSLQGARGKDKQVSWWFQAPPGPTEPPVPEAFRVGRVDHEPPAGAQDPAALRQETDGVLDVLQDVMEGDLVRDAAGKTRVLEAPAEHVDPAGPGQPCRNGVRLDTQHVPPQGLHARKKVPPAAPHVDEKTLRPVHPEGEGFPQAVEHGPASQAGNLRQDKP